MIGEVGIDEDGVHLRGRGFSTPLRTPRGAEAGERVGGLVEFISSDSLEFILNI